MLIVETFSAIQGEGLLAGTPSTFIRLFGCNLRCSWCDSSYTYEGDGGFDEKTLRRVGNGPTDPDAPFEMRPQDLVPKVRGHGNEHIVITGGEPMMQWKELRTFLEALSKAGNYHVTIETNGTYYRRELLPLVDLWSVSPKLPTSGMKFPLANAAKYGEMENAYLKFVISDRAKDIPFLINFLQHHPTFHKVYLQPDASWWSPTGPRDASAPIGEYIERCRKLRDSLFQHDTLCSRCCLMPQLHFFLDGWKEAT